MKRIFIISFLLIYTVSYSQRKVVEKIETNANEINIYTKGLDDLVLENSDSEFLEIYLSAESYDNQFIYLEEVNKEINIKFNFEGTETREVIFRKFITRRLQRASAIVKIPKGKKVYVFGENVDIESKNLKNDLAIYIENGIVKLNEIKANINLKLYAGNVYATLKNTNIDVTSNLGKIKIDDIIIEKVYKKKHKTSPYIFTVNSVKANILLTTQKTQ